MPSHAHEQAISELKNNPVLLQELLRRVKGRYVTGTLAVHDSVLRTNPIEARPDLLFTGDDGWLGVEVQLQPDEAKARRWLLMLVLLINELGPGDLVVLTHSKRIAKWAATIARWSGRLGGAAHFLPVVLLLDESTVEKLLDPTMPALGFFAAWAMQDRHGDDALAIVDEAVRLIDALPPGLQKHQLTAILSVLNDAMIARLRSRMSSTTPVSESPALKLFKQEIEARGEARGEARVLVRQLGQKGFVLTEEQRQRIQGCTDLAQLDRWLDRVLTARTLDEVLAP